jgi:histone deacetylase 8
MNKENCAYIYSAKLLYELDKISKIRGRGELVNSLMSAYNLFESIKIVNPTKADERVIKSFHSVEYVEHLKFCTSEQDEEKIFNDSRDDFGIGYDCEIIENVFEFCSVIAGASITAAHLINMSQFNYCINWFGGWHHAKREKASGFCYINDIVLCILKLRQKFNRVLYLDLDMHHGDGVQEAFEYTNKVLTASFHKWGPGFFPGSGSIDEIGKGTGKTYTINVPLQGGIDDSMYYELFRKIFQKIINVYRPEVIVTQCGADGLYGDPIDSQDPFNLTVDGFCKCVKLIIDTKIPTIFLGGGGYNFANSSRLWCKIAGMLTQNQQLKNDIPEHDQFLHYGPDYELSTARGLIKNKNTQEYIDEVSNFVCQNLSNIKIE